MNKKAKKQNSFLFSVFKYHPQKKGDKKTVGLVFSRFLFFTLGLFFSVAVFGVYADWNTTVSPGELLTAERWNELVDYVGDYTIQNIAVDQGLTIDVSNNIGLMDCAADQIVQRSADDATWICADNLVATGWNHIATRNIQMSNFWLSGDGGDEGIFVDNSGNVGIGTTTPSYALEVEGGDAYFNNDVYMGSLEFLQDSGMVSAFDMQVTASAPDNTVEGYIFSVDGSQILTIYSQSNGAGSVDTTRVGIGITTPNAKLDVAGDMKILDGGAFGGYSTSDIYKVTTPTLYAEQAQFGNPAGGLMGSGSINVSTICIGGVCQNSWSGIGSAGGWTDDGTTVRLTAVGDKVGVGTTAPAEKLEIKNDTDDAIAKLRITDTNDNPELQLQYGSGANEHWAMYVDNFNDAEAAQSKSLNIWSYNGGVSGNRMTILQNGDVGIGTTNPVELLSVFTNEANGNTRIELGDTNQRNVYFLLNKPLAARRGEFQYEIAGVNKWNLGMPDSDEVGDGSEFFIGTTSGGTNSALWIETNGNVGIGTTAPTQKLHVEGQCVTGDTLLPILEFKEILDSNNQKTTSGEMAYGSLTSLSVRGLDKSNYNITYQNNLSSSLKGVEIRGVEPPKRDLSSPQGKPAIPRPKVLYQNIQYIAIKDIQPGMKVLSLNEKTGRLEPAEIKGLLDMGIKPIYKLTTESGKTIRTTGNHPYLTRRENKKTILSSGHFAELVVEGDVKIKETPMQGASFESLMIRSVCSIELPPLSYYNNISIQNVCQGIKFGNKKTLVDSAGFAPATVGGNPTVLLHKTTSPQPRLNILYQEGDETASWTKIAELSVGDEIAAVEENWVVFDHIAKIEQLPPEQVYDIEVEGTHNFVANGIIAHNTYISGNVGIGTTVSESDKLKVQGSVSITGDLSVEGIFNAGGADVAEEFATMEELGTGTVVIIGDNGYKSAKPCDKAYDTKVIGVVSDNPAVIMGKVESEHKAVIAIVGVVTVNATSTNGAINKGDLLTTSNIYGRAMKAGDAKIGSIIGKALEYCDEEICAIKAFINLQ